MEALKQFRENKGRVVLNFEPKVSVIYSVKVSVYGYQKHSKMACKNKITIPLTTYVKEHEEMFIKRTIGRVNLKNVYLIECTYLRERGKALN